MTLPFGLLFSYTENMAKSTKSVIQKTCGRPATGVDPLVALRFPVTTIAVIDARAAKDEISRSEAIRRLVEIGLEAKSK